MGPRTTHQPLELPRNSGAGHELVVADAPQAVAAGVAHIDRSRRDSTAESVAEGPTRAG